MVIDKIKKINKLDDCAEKNEKAENILEYQLEEEYTK